MWVAWNNYWNWLTRQNLGPLILLISELHLKPKLNLQGLGVSRTTTDLLWGILVPGFMVWNFMKPLNKHRKSDPDLTTLPETNSLPLKNDVSVLGRLPLFFCSKKPCYVRKLSDSVFVHLSALLGTLWTRKKNPIYIPKIMYLLYLTYPNPLEIKS